MKSICLISGSSPRFLGGISLYQKNLIHYAKKKKLDLKFTWIYPGKKNVRYYHQGFKCIEIKSFKYPLLKEFYFSRKVRKLLKKEKFDIINTHANWGYCLRDYLKKKNQKIIHTYHGVTAPYMKIQFVKFGLLRYLFYPLLPLFHLSEKPPMEKADKVICVSNKVKYMLQQIYKSKRKMQTIRTGVDLKVFKKLNKEKSRKELKLKGDKIYGLYSGRGGYWNKGLSRAVSLGKELYNQNKNFRLIVIGSDKKKCEKYLKEKFITYKGVVKRQALPGYYSACNFFLFLSRSEGGAPALALSEALASECLSICSSDSRPEILLHKKDCLIIESYGKIQSKQILNLLKNKTKTENMKKSAKNKMINLSLEKWGEKYFEVILK